MNATIEKGFAAIVTAALPDLHVREATSSAPLPSDLQLIVVECPEVEHVVGPLHRATLKLWLGTPAFEHGEREHRLASARLMSALADPTAAATAFDAAAAPLCLRGFHIRSQSEETVENTWRSTLELVAGIATG